MKLYLCSYRIPAQDQLYELVGKSPSETKVAIIPNAQDYYAPRARNVKIRDIQNYLQDLEFKTKVIDLVEYDNSAKLKADLSSFDLLWVAGGNTFCLRHQMKRSGFDTIINDLINEGIVFAGESAGACIAGNTLKGLELADDPQFADEIIWEGLNLIPKFILPHSDNEMFKDDIDHARQLYKKDELIELTDSQALVINGSNQTVVTGAKQ